MQTAFQRERRTQLYIVLITMLLLIAIQFLFRSLFSLAPLPGLPAPAALVAAPQPELGGTQVASVGGLPVAGTPAGLLRQLTRGNMPTAPDGAAPTTTPAGTGATGPAPQPATGADAGAPVGDVIPTGTTSADNVPPEGTSNNFIGLPGSGVGAASIVPVTPLTPETPPTTTPETPGGTDPGTTNPGTGGGGTNPENPGTNPENPGTNPENPGTNPENPGTNPENPGTDQGTPGTVDPEPGPPAVPEPETWAMMAIGGGMLKLTLWRRRKRAAKAAKAAAA